MNKFKIIVVVLIIIVGGVFAFKYITDKQEEERIAKIKEGWYVEIVTDTLNIRKEANRNSASLGEAKKGEVYTALDIEINGSNYWYKIEYEDEKYGWVANPTSDEYLKDVNNPNDIASPTIRFFDEVYYVNSIDDINYKHLEVTDDKDGVVVTHKVFHEVDESQGKDQYWIQYTATDAVGKTTSKVQRIKFNTRPDESEVYDFSELER